MFQCIDTTLLHIKVCHMCVMCFSMIVLSSDCCVCRLSVPCVGAPKGGGGFGQVAPTKPPKTET